MSSSMCGVEFYSNGSPDFFLGRTASNPYDDVRIKNTDRVLHCTLSEIFHEQRYMSKDQLKEFIRGPAEPTDEGFIFKLILEREPDLGKLLFKRSQISLLWIAVLCGYQDSAELLVRFGADVNELYAVGYMPGNSFVLTKKSSVLHALFRMFPSSWNERFIGLVIEHGADLNVRDHLKRTVLHLAVEYGRVQLTEILLAEGADINAIDQAGMTPLLEAARSKEFDKQLPLLMKHGADILAKDKFDQNALHFLTSAPGEHTEMAGVLIEKGVSLDDRHNAKMYQPIHMAVMSGKIELVKHFLKHGADVNARGQKGETPLMNAARYCENPAMIVTLLEHGADIDMQTSHGSTVLYDLAVMNFMRDNVVEKIKILISVGADLFAAARDDFVAPFDVMSFKSIENPCIRLALKSLALKQTYMPQLSIEFNEEKFPMLRDYYQGCIREINRIKTTRVYNCGSFIELLTKCQCQVVSLMRHREFVIKFRVLYQLGTFSLYVEELREAFERAACYYNSVLEQEYLIDDASYNILPYLITRKLSRYAVSCDVCDLKKTVNASRSISFG
ncbi:serine/threonine-protein phosphatase 6 regulatory ankyrin repeat subunit B-like [Nasonia vitripennis]|uniref:Uncharacterized protein n=1 Tax=Nasonia vitripennis TaxID=7425 RepID=A0A7M7QIK5_NASVI|nr:serine/threonine-protein phosphatase 6 regulatory ankyrin repeat subunit B-like [Nasonia vitripennis]